MFIYFVIVPTLINVSLASTYFALRRRDGQSDSTLLPTWQTICSVAFNVLLLLLYTLTLCFRKELKRSAEVFYIRTGVMLFTIGFYAGVTFKSGAVDIHTQYVFPSTFELSCINPSVRCNVGMAQNIFAFFMVFFGIFEAAVRGAM
ncbi:hypothetical protein BGX29_010608 [Mortierella sp. GBA35]|nr:hypothetical protein BGX29_010608 [Mortierella sp. GBA35]